MDSDEHLPRLEHWLSPWRSAVGGLLLLAAIAGSALIASGHLVSRMLSAERALLFLVMLIPLSAWLIYKSAKMNHRRPLILISPEGIMYQGLANRVIRWTEIDSAKAMDRPVSLFHSMKLLRISLKQGIDKDLMKQVGRWNIGTSSTTFDLPAQGFSRPPSEVERIVNRYIARYGKVTEAASK